MVRLMSEKSRCRILFVNEASSLIGMGHILRSLVLARIMFMRGYDVSGITIGDEKAISYAKERAKLEQFEFSIRMAPDFQSAIEFILHDDPCVVVVDCTKASKDIVFACAKNGITSVALDYFIAEQPLPTAVINLIDHNPDTLSGHPPAREGVFYFEGPQYAIIRDEFLAARDRRIFKSERNLLRKIVIAFGGADPSENTKRALNILAKWSGKFAVDLIIGPLFTSEIKPVTASVRHKCDMIIHTSPISIGKLFEEADLVFCGGGGTLLEAICLGIPAIVIAQNEAELRHAKSLAQRHACWVSEDIDWKTVSSVENRKKRSKYARACVDGLGAERISDVIEQQLN
jgi:spore coat polysaccharide biosynthesis predicted glycosyltransferase SpsG